MTGSPAAALLTQADSARAVASVYTASLLATVPLVIAAILAVSLRRSSAEGRSLIWRSAIAALLLVFVGRQLPLHWIAWVVPSTLAAPLIALGRVQVTGSVASLQNAHSGSSALVGIAFWLYVAGVALVLVPTIVALARARSRLNQSIRVRGDRWETALSVASETLGVVRPVRLFVDRHAAIPMTWGLVHPVVILPIDATTWSDEQLRIVLLHELGHIRARDWAFTLVARIVCGLYWFHPGVWWLARSFRDDCEVGCDDRVIAAGIRRSDYAEVLVRAAASLGASAYVPRSPALALSRARGLRGRVAAILDTRHSVRPLARGWSTIAMLATVSVAGPVSAVQLAPTREVLTSLMRDARWESRAYAVLGLAQRPDSIAVARDAAELDPNPSVRAWARYALGQRAGRAELRNILPGR